MAHTMEEKENDPTFFLHQMSCSGMVEVLNKLWKVATLRFFVAIFKWLLFYCTKKPSVGTFVIIFFILILTFLYFETFGCCQVPWGYTYEK